jgi:hypothetical protein
MADSMAGVITDLSGSVTTTNTTTIVAQQTGATVITASELDTTKPAATSTKITVTPSTDNHIPVLYGTSYVPGMIIDARISNDSQTMYYIYALTEITGSGSATVDEVWMGEQKLNFANNQHPVVSATNPDGTTDTNPAGYIDVWVFRERTTAIFGAGTGTTESIVPGLTTLNQYGGLYVAVVKVKYNATLGYTSMPQMTFKMTNTLSNPGAVWYDFMTNTRYGAGIPLTRVDSDSSINSTNPMSLYSVSAETVTYRDTAGADTTGPRYTINGLIAGGNIRDNVRKINLASGSWSTWNPKIGKWIVVPNRPYVENENLFEFSDSNIISGINVSTTSLDSNYNAMAITYPETAIKAQNHTVRVSLFDDNPELLNVNEPENTLSLTLDLVDNRVQATRIGLLELKQAREDIVAIFHANYTALQVDSGDIITITNTGLGWTNKLFRVTRVRELESDSAEIQVEISALEYNPDVYADESIDQFEPVANTDIPRRASSGQLQALDVATIPDDLYNPIATIPSFAVRAIVPSNRIYDTLEFFISGTTAGGIYTYYGTLKPEGGVFQPDTTHDLMVTGLPDGEYFFKVRAKIGALTTPLSLASSGVTWTPGVILNEQALATAFEWSPPTVVVPTDSVGNNPTTGQTVELVLRVGTTKLNLSSATSDAAQANNTWRVTNITYNNTNLDLSAPVYDTTNDRVVWTINDLNALQENLVVTIRYKNSSGELNDIGTTRVLATQLRAGADGSTSRALRLISSSNYFTRLKGESDATAVNYLPAAINLTAQLNNITGGTVTWSARDANNNPITLNTNGSTAILSNSAFGNRDYVVVHAEIDSGGITYFDEQTIVRLREGADGVTGITAFLSNEVAALPAATDGTYQSSDLAAISSQLKIYAGTVDITEQYTLTIDSETGCDANIVTAPGSNYGRITLATVSADLGNVTVRAAKAGSASIYKTFVLVKQRRGAAGADGDAAQLLRVSATSPIISIGKNGSISNTATHQPAAITYYADTVNFSGTTITWTGQREGQASVALGTGTTLTLTAAQIRDLLTTSESVRTATVTATTNLDGIIFSDTTSVNRVREGSDTITAYLTNELTAVPTTSSGEPISSNFSGVTSDLKLVLGSAMITTGITYSIVSSSGVSAPTIQSAAESNPGRIQIAGITSDTATVVARATLGGVNFDKTFTIVKQRQGLEGVARRVEISGPIGFTLPKNTPDANTNYTPATLTLNATRVNIASTTPVRWFIVLGGTEIEQTGTASTNLNNYQALSFTPGNVISRNAPVLARQYWQENLRFRARLIGDDGIDYFDDFTPVLIRQQSETPFLILSNQAISFASTSVGVFPTNQFPAYINATVMIGGVVSPGWTFDFSRSEVYSYASPSFTAVNNEVTITGVSGIPSGINETVFRRGISVRATKAGFDDVVGEITISLLRSGTDAATQVFLTNEVHNLSADYTGVVNSYTNAYTDVYVYEKGAPANASQWSFTINPNADASVGYTKTVYTGTDGRIGRVAISSMSIDSRALTITATKAGSSGTYTKMFSLNRVSAGAPGQNAAGIRAVASTQVVKISNTGVPSPTSIDLTAQLSGSLAGLVVSGWEFLAGSGTLTAGGTNNVKYLNTGTLTDVVTTIRVWYNNPGEATTVRRYSDTFSIIKVVDGATGQSGGPGNRGSRVFNQSITGTAFNITTAYTAAQISGGPVPGDTVTQYNNGAAFTATKIWTGAIAGANDSGNWTTVNNIIDGNLLVTGSVRADKIYATDTFTMNVQSNNFISGTQGWSINSNGVAEFSNITARGTIEAAGIYTGSTLRDKYVYDTVAKDYPIYTTATRTLTPVVYTNNTKPIPLKPTVNNWGAPSTDVNYHQRELLKGPFAYNSDPEKENYVGIRSGFADSVVSGTAPSPLFATSGSWGSGGNDRIENRVRRFLSTADEIAFGGSISLTTNAPMLEVFYYVHNDQSGVTGFNTSLTPFYNKIRPIARYYNPILYRRILSDTGTSILPQDESIIRTAPWRVTALSNITYNGATKLQVTLENFNSVSVAAGDTFHLAGGSAPTSSINNWSGALTTTGAAWLPGSTTLGVGSFGEQGYGVKVIGVVNASTIVLDCSMANAATYGSGLLGFNTVGEQWINYSNQDVLTNLNDVWTFNFTSKVKWSDFYSGTAPAFPAGGIKGWSLHIGVRAPETYSWWHINPYITGYIQNL